MPHLRFLNASDGEHLQKWQFKRQSVPIMPIGSENKTDLALSSVAEGWEDLPGGEQRLCYNEIPTKVNWHYICFDFDLATMQCTGFQLQRPGLRRLRLRLAAHAGHEEPVVHAQPGLFRRNRHRQARLRLSRSVCLSGDF